MKTFINLTLAVLILSSCAITKETNKSETSATSKNDNKAPIGNGCICVELWMPVCGENGKTYSNSCFANCARIKYSQGSCEKHFPQ